MAKEYKAFSKEEKERIKKQYIFNITELNKGLPDDKKLKFDFDKLEARLNDPNEVKIYRISQEIKEKLDKQNNESKRVKIAYGDNKRDFLNRSFRYLLKPGDTEEERKYNDNLYKTYLENPYKVFQDAVKTTITINPSDYFKAAQNGNVLEQLEFLDKNLEKTKLGFSLKADIDNQVSGIEANGELKDGIRLSDEFKQMYSAPFRSAFMLGGAEKIIDVTATDYYFTIPPLEEYIEDINFKAVDKTVEEKAYRVGSSIDDSSTVKKLKDHPEIEVGDNFFINYKAIKNVNGKEVEVDIEAGLNDKTNNVKFIKRPQEEIDVLLNPIDKDYLKVINGEITQKEYDDIELKKYLDYVEDLVRNPSKYHNEKEPDFTKPLTDKEREDFENRYKNNVEIYNKVLPKDKKITLDLEELHNKMDDPKQVEIYRREKFLNEKIKKQEAIFDKNKDLTGASVAPLNRDLSYFMKTDGSKQSEDFNIRLLKLYSLHPYEFGQRVLKGLCDADLSAYKAFLKDDNERTKAFYDNFENISISFNESFIKNNMKKDGGLVNEFNNVDTSKFLQHKIELSASIENPNLVFEMPKMTNEQLIFCANNGDYPDYTNKASLQLKVNVSGEGKKIAELLDKNNILDEKESFIAYKAIETKDGIEKEIPLFDALSKNDPNIKIVKRTEEEKERIFQITNGIKRREELAKITKEPTAKDSLIVHQEAIKKYLDTSIKFKNHAEDRFDILYGAHLGIDCINNAINLINKNLDVWFEDKEEILNIAKQNGFKIENGKINGYGIKTISEDLRNIKLEFFDRIEEKMKNDDVIELRNAVKGDGNLFERNHVHVLAEKINEIKNNIPNNFTKKEKDEYINALDNINAKVFTTNRDDFVEKDIDISAQRLKREAKNEFENFAKSLKLSKEDEEIFLESDDGSSQIEYSFVVQTEEQFETFANVNKERPRVKLNDDVKNKVLNLSKLVDETGIFEKYAYGETPDKIYGFTTFYDKQLELDELLKKDISSFTDEEKKGYSKEVIKKSNELNELEAKYDRVLDYINNIFNMNSISSNENIYSGRPNSNKSYGLLEKWDYKNARAGVILNGLAQLYGACKEAGMSVREYLDDPEKGQRIIIENKRKEIEKPYILPKEDNSLGKRLARASIIDNSPYEAFRNRIMALSRDTEFLFAIDQNRKDTIQNINSEAVFRRGFIESVKSGLDLLDRSSNFSNKVVPNYNNLINILMFGDEAKDNVLEPCDGFHNNDFKRSIVPNYMDKYKQMMENPGEAFKNIASTINDYIKEKNIIFDENEKRLETSKNPKEEPEYNEAFLPEHIVVVGKVMLENMLKANNMTVDDIKDLEARKNIQEYLENPVKSLSDMFGKNFAIDQNELELFEQATQNAMDDYEQSKASRFENTFFDDMKKANPDKEPNMYKIAEKHQIGFFEGLFNTKATKNFSKLLDAIDGLSEKESKYYGKPEKIAQAAQAYLDHKYRNGKTLKDLSGEAKQRAIFCENLIKTFDKSFKLGLDFFIDDSNAPVVNEAKTNDQNEKVVENNVLNEKVNVIAEKEPEREAVLTLAEDTNIEKKDTMVQKAKEAKVNEKTNEKIQDMNQPSN